MEEGEGGMEEGGQSRGLACLQQLLSICNTHTSHYAPVTFSEKDRNWDGWNFMILFIESKKAIELWP